MGGFLGYISHIFEVLVSSWLPLHLWCWQGGLLSKMRDSDGKEGFGECYFCLLLPNASAGSSPFTVSPWSSCREERGFNVRSVPRWYSWWSIGERVEGPCPGQSPWKGLWLREGGTLEEMMLLCTSFGCPGADSSKQLALGGRNWPYWDEGLPLPTPKGLNLTLPVGFEPLVGVKHMLLLDWHHPLSIWKEK